MRASLLRGDKKEDRLSNGDIEENIKVSAGGIITAEGGEKTSFI